MDIEAIVARVVEKIVEKQDDGGIPVGVSNRHVHLSKEDSDILFGKDYEFKKLKDLSQPGQFACNECITLVGPKGVLEKVRILGPVRGQTQIELLQTDCRKLGIKAVLKESGKLEGTPGILISGPMGSVHTANGALVAKRHIHMKPEDAERHGLKDKDLVDLECGGERGGILKNVLIRVSSSYKLDCHLDVEEASAMGLKDGDHVHIMNNRR